MIKRYLDKCSRDILKYLSKYFLEGRKYMKNILRKLKYIIFPPKMVKVTIMTSAPERKLEDEIILITGGATGIGKATAKASVEQRARVIVVGRREELLQETCRELGNEYCKYITCDVTSIRDYTLFWKQAESLYDKKITAIVCNAGVYMSKEPFEWREAEFEQCISTNLEAPFFMIQQFVKYCINAAVPGNIVVTASNRGLMGDCGPYGVSKAGIINYVQGMARTYLLNGIRINAVAPGMTASEINHVDISGDMYTGSARGERILVPQEIAEVICFLLSKNSRCITGAVIPCDEGDSLR